MNKLSLIACCTLLMGCRGVNRLLTGPEPDPNPVNTISSIPPLPPTPPIFNIPIPSGTIKQVFYGELTGNIQIAMVPTNSINVFMLDRAIGQWFQLGSIENGAFWYTYDPIKDILQIHGQHLEQKAYCIYQYVSQ